MIRYALKCDQGHRFESWFQSADAFDALCRAGHVTCATCGSADVRKAIMAPRVVAARGVETRNAAGEISEQDDRADHDAAASGAGARPETEQSRAEIRSKAAAIARIRKAVEDNSTYVGGNFAREARDMYLGDTPARSIYGEANPAEAKALIEDGVPVMPLPFIPKAKAH